VSAHEPVRRQSADAVLERDYARLRAHVLRAAAGALQKRNVLIDESDLDPHYNSAWYALHGRLARGETIANVEGFLVVIVMRRAFDDLRRVDRERRHVAHEFPSELVPDRAHDGDVLVRFEDHRALGELFEGLRERLSERERRAFALCYLAGYTRPQAAPVIGVPPARMEKIMDGVSQKVGALAELIRADGWCESRRSLVAAYALGVVQPGSPRHRLADDHLRRCARCRRYVRLLRGLGPGG
jgi:DNA-directed RNA polymerase specialized sigma24 family protein